MAMRSFILLCFLFCLIHPNPIDENLKSYKIFRHRNVNIMSGKSADILFKEFYLNEKQQNDINTRMKRSKVSVELRPVEGPINIEQLPAMLAARNVKRYPYSQHDDPAIIGR
ncbi:unnamed protein product [Rotaria magnacalcarata]|uniref:Uncharacterized protein n=1 Tax=Rotaria magnacalcarata TaxID=392030 RepID=A0A816Z7E1_9BILA|nr:unnamed protein product [Rotaria magnacalcarata]CAF2198933.1 unnamed protein product [Rotaria magnacalcarata]